MNEALRAELLELTPSSSPSMRRHRPRLPGRTLALMREAVDAVEADTVGLEPFAEDEAQARKLRG